MTTTPARTTTKHGNETAATVAVQRRPLLSLEEEVVAEALLQDLRPSKRVPCGKEKCFYYGKLNYPHGGYLIARCSRDYNDRGRLQRLQWGWTLAQRLVRQYNISHFLRSDVQVIAVSSDLSQFLNRHLYMDVHDAPLKERGVRYGQRFPEASSVYVQTVQVAPQPSLLLAVAPANRHHFDVHVKEFLLSVVMSNDDDNDDNRNGSKKHSKRRKRNNRHRSSKSKEARAKSFLRRLHNNLIQTKQLLRKEPCLIKDFQVLMDTTGQLYHLDFDRCFQSRKVDETDATFEYLTDVEIRVRNIVRDIIAGNSTFETIQQEAEERKQRQNATTTMKTTENNTTTTTTSRSNSTAKRLVVDNNDDEEESKIESKLYTQVGDDDDNKEVATSKTTTATETTMAAQLESSFRPGNLLEMDQVPCGKEKCFFRTKSDPNIAYLVARSSDKDNRRSRFQTLVAGWELAEQLRQDHGIQHFLLEPPTNVTITKELASTLNHNLYSERLQKMFKANNNSNVRFPEGSIAYIQKVRTAPVPNIVIGCAESKQVSFAKDFGPFFATVTNKRTFVRRFERNFEQARTLVRNDVVGSSCLQKDFQILVDTRGNVYHLDFDRCFNPETGEKKHTTAIDLVEAPCVKALDDIAETIHLAGVAEAAATSSVVN